ncbi:hypothetical protein E2C01_019114 [Portunus trituberculatus]|uniref:Uncharacterized protein n=1 Tax=Portunus trituberculatus TaxID=210409 RepID=A0A5B7DYA7_PORTR|nr:hypothetical protein [Portunus trituberculatus]
MGYSSQITVSPSSLIYSCFFESTSSPNSTPRPLAILPPHLSNSVLAVLRGLTTSVTPLLSRHVKA